MPSRFDFVSHGLRFLQSGKATRRGGHKRHHRLGRSRGRAGSAGVSIETLEVRQVLDSTVVFNEVMYNPAGAVDDQMEWIELYNQLTVDIDISDWELRGAVDFKFPDHTVVPGKGYLLVAANPEQFHASHPDQTALGPWTGQIGNGGDRLLLYNNDERRLNEVNFSDNGDWPSGPDGTGLTLAKRSTTKNSEDAENWTFSEQIGGTPGTVNFLTGIQKELTTLLAASSPATAMVPSNDSLGQTWTATDFNDSSWLQGTGGVGYDTQVVYNPYFGLDLDEPPNGQTAMPLRNVNTSVYIRFPFELTGNTFDFETISMRTRYDDGFVAYLNGVEVASRNAPGRDGDTSTLTWNSAATATNADSKAAVFESIDLGNLNNLLRQGQNVLALHGLNRTIADSDLLFDIELVGEKTLDQRDHVPLKFNEVAAADAASFFLEIVNDGDAPINLTGFGLIAPDTTIPRYALPSQTLAPGQFLVVTGQQLGATAPKSGDHFLLQGPKGFVTDAVRVVNSLRGRAPSRDNAWMAASQASPGAANVFQLTDDIVINEIMYSPTPELAIADILPTYSPETVVSMTDTTWAYNDTGAALPANWAEQSYAVDNQNWQAGQGLIAYESSTLAYPINTVLQQPSTRDPRFATYYFQTTFMVTDAQLAETDRLALRHMIDDGAIFYVNGIEVSRFNLPSSGVDSTTLASVSVPNAALVGPDEISKSVLRSGVNTFSAEVHMRTLSDSDIVFGAQLDLETQITPLIPGSPYRDRDEMEYVELFNRGNSTIDISDWKFSDAIDFKFPQGTTVGAHQYLVIAKDKTAFNAIYPNVPALGDYNGSLSNHDERIRLIDKNGNLADSVHYFEGGRWPATADAGGSSLELIDPFADNNRGESWAASDESSKSEWTTVTFTDTAKLDVFNQKARFDEFLFGILDAGEFLIDDVRVIKDAHGAAIDVIQNGTFEGDALGAAPAKWRLIGNHSGTVEVDPTNPANKVLHVVSTGAQANVHDHAETTFANSEDLIDGIDYTLSFRVKWITGSSQINSRLWFNRLSNTAHMDIPLDVGTPGAVNGSIQANLGPSYAAFSHSPAVPTDKQAVTVSVRPEDPAGIGQVTLFWRLDGQAWQQVAMTNDGKGLYQGTIPAQASGKIVQFYTQAVDQSGVASTFPADGRDSRALYQVEDGIGPSTPIDKFRIVMLAADRSRMFAQVNRMSNWTIPITLVHNDELFYDVTVRQTGSRWIRPNSGYKINLSPEQPYLDFHDTIRLDLNGLAEIVMKQMLNRAGGSKASNYDDLGFVISPMSSHNNPVIVQLARYENTYLDEQFVDGSSGTKWELDDVTVPTAPQGGVEGLKADTDVNQNADFGVNSSIVAQQGANPEFYRAHVLIKSNRAKDNFAAIARFSQAIHKNGDELFAASNEVMDVDLWMRHYAHQSYFGNWDTYGFGRPKNLRIYQRPEDGKIVPLFWDCDLCNFTETIKKANEPLSRLDEIRDIPHNLRLYWGHMNDMMNQSFNQEYVADWAGRYGALVGNFTGGGDETFTSIAASTAARNRTATSNMLRDIPKIDFQIDGDSLSVDTPTVVLTGKGWVDVREIHLAGSDTPLNAFWPEKDGWRIELPLSSATQTFTLEAYDYEGKLISTDSIDVQTSAVNPVLGSLRITEIQYNPATRTQAERDAGVQSEQDFEFIELMNIGTQSISLADVQLVRVGDNQEGVDFQFANGAITTLAPGQAIVVVEDENAARIRYGNIPIAGTWSGGLDNGGEMITLTVNGAVLQQFTYQDAWYPDTDGNGPSLEIINPSNPDLQGWNVATNWRASASAPGTPGQPDVIVGDANHDGVFNSSDLVLVFQAGEYEDDVPLNSTFEEGDFDGDGDFTTRDFVYAFQYGVYADAAAARAGDDQVSTAAVATVPVVTAPAHTREFRQTVRRRQDETIPTIDSIFANWQPNNPAQEVADSDLEPIDRPLH